MIFSIELYSKLREQKFRDVVPRWQSEISSESLDASLIERLCYKDFSLFNRTDIPLELLYASVKRVQQKVERAHQIVERIQQKVGWALPWKLKIQPESLVILETICRNTSLELSNASFMRFLQNLPGKSLIQILLQSSKLCIYT